MQNSVKKAALFSVIINVLLVICLFYCNKQQRFSGFQEIHKTVERSNNQIITRNQKTIDNAIPIMSVKPELEWVLQNEFCLNRMEVDGFVKQVDSLSNQGMSNINMNKVLLDYNTSLCALEQLYNKHSLLAYKPAKLSKSELDLRIEHFHLNVFDDCHFQMEDIESLSNDEKETVLMGMKSHLILVEAMANRDFLGFIGGRMICRGNIFFPFVITSHSEDITKGKVFEADISLGSFALTSPNQKDFFSVYLDGKKLDIEDDLYNLELDADSIGRKSMETVVVWSDGSYKGYDVDTSFYHYTVTP